jgi:hypothetical protein
MRGYRQDTLAAGRVRLVCECRRTESQPGLACCAIVELDEGEEASAEAVYLKCPPVAWKLVSD